MDSHLSPAEIAIRFGISIKALRLHQILVLKRLGLSLRQIGELLVGENTLEPILAVQERALRQDSERITRALALIRKARAKLASGDILSIDDLATLTQETVVTTHSTAEELKETVAPFQRKHLTPQEQSSLEAMKQRASGASDDAKESMKAMKQPLDEAKTLMTAGDATTPAAMDFARRFRAVGRHVKSIAPSALVAMRPNLKAAMDDARSDPAASQKIEVFAFVEKALANLKMQEDNSSSKD